MLKKTLNGSRILLVQSDPIVALKLAEGLSSGGAEVVTTFGLPESFHEIGRCRLDGAIVHLDLDGASALPVAVLLQEIGVPIVVVSPNRMSAFLGRRLPRAVALERGSSPELAIATLMRTMRRRAASGPVLAASSQAPHRQN